MKRDHLLPEDVRQRLSAFGQLLISGPTPDNDALETVLADLAGLPSEAVARAAVEINTAAKLGWAYDAAVRPVGILSLFDRRPPRPLTERQLMVADRRYAWLFLFHANGRIREAALDRLVDPPATPFLFAAIVLRLNDWVPQVRSAAARCAERLFPLTEPDIAAQAALTLVDKAFKWERWSDERHALDAVFANPEVAARFSPIFMTRANGPLATRLRQLLRYPGFDGDLADLAQGAVQPAVRATALKCLIERKVSWPVGFRWRWIDKVYNVGQRVVVTDSRQIVDDHDPATLVRQGLQDRSAVVRRVAADALIERRASFHDAERLIARMAADRSPSIRERADYMIRHPLDA